MSTIGIHVLNSRVNVTTGVESLIACASAGYFYRVVNNRGKDILHGRTIGYNETDSKYVSFVDDDDETMLTKEHVQEIILRDKPALFTNSVTVDKEIEKVQVSPVFRKWNIHSEKSGYIRPHQTIVYQKDVALDLLKATKDIIKNNHWDPNDCDVVMRMLASVLYGWDYFPEVTYRWNVHLGGDHFKRPHRATQIRKYIFG